MSRICARYQAVQCVLIDLGPSKFPRRRYGAQYRGRMCEKCIQQPAGARTVGQSAPHLAREIIPYAVALSSMHDTRMLQTTDGVAETSRALTTKCTESKIISRNRPQITATTRGEVASLLVQNKPGREPSSHAGRTVLGSQRGSPSNLR